ncbi:MAG: ferredoxin [Bacteroidaceae bacterium]|nr:ferredoxin [Bacteroidaceae bacterium]
MVLNERDMRHEHVIECAKQMMTAARTAPKAKGVDIIEVMMITDDDIVALSNALHQIGENLGRGGLMRDAGNLLEADAVVLIASREEAMCLNCGYCGFPTCGERPAGVPCAMNTIDVGIAVGSAVATAADLRLDTRVMYSAGYAALKLGWMPGCNYIIGIPVSASSKNPFFDRKRKTPAQ